MPLALAARFPARIRQRRTGLAGRLAFSNSRAGFSSLAHTSRAAARGGALASRRFATVGSSAPALFSRRFCRSGAAAGACFAAALCWSRRGPVLAETGEPELPLCQEPQKFVHPYKEWPWYRKALFFLKRSIFLAYIFAPFIFTSTLVLVWNGTGRVHGPLREFWLRKMLVCMQHAGAAFQKFGQWLSMRPDMFPPDVIETLAQLRSDAPAHSTEVSRQEVQEEMGLEVMELFEEFQDEPIASGSVGQVHRARLRECYALDGPGGRYRDVAVKIRHPGVADSAFMDLDILWMVVDLSQRFLHMTTPFARGEFDEVIQRQMDFTREAFNLQQFARNFKGEEAIRFPKVSPKFVTDKVLIETWADGKLISNILEDFDNATGEVDESSVLVRAKRKVQVRLSLILYDLSMKMMIRDNFVHGDLHGGNILYSENDNFVTVIDAGIATSLQPESRQPFGKFLYALCSGDTPNIVTWLQHFNQSKMAVNVPEFTVGIQKIMDKFYSPTRPNAHLPVNAADMFGEVMFLMQDFGMLLKGDVASTLFTISISEGLVRQLDPTLDVATNALPYIARHMPGIFLNRT